MGDPNDPDRVRQSFLSKGNATIGRWLAASGPNGPTLAKLEKAAAHFGLQPWQLLVEGLDPSNPPEIVKGGALEKEFRRRVAALIEEMGIERRTRH